MWFYANNLKPVHILYQIEAYGTMSFFVQFFKSGKSLTTEKSPIKAATPRTSFMAIIPVNR